MGFKQVVIKRDVGHKVTEEMWQDVRDWFRNCFQQHKAGSWRNGFVKKRPFADMSSDVVPASPVTSRY